jgi:hypothetical protein
MSAPHGRRALMIITIRVPDEEGKKIRHTAIDRGLSVPAFALAAIRAAMTQTPKPRRSAGQEKKS